ncbi:MAG: ABC transporter permease, partial [Thermoanaerobaculia bacterium]|nr:ABC transporter permease [Thermoanaerobaculia bacterium]
MIYNYLKIAIRNLLRHKSFSFINLFGLSSGLACCLLIGLYIWNELSFDRYHEKADRIWRISRKFYNKDGSQQLHLGHLAPPFGPLLKNDFPDMEEVTRLLQTNTTVRIGEQFFSEDQMFYAEPNVFRVFDIPLQAGSPAAALNEPYSVMLNETTAKKYFGTTDPMNRILRFSGRFDLKVTGVFQDFPYNSHFHPALLVSFSTLNDTLVYGAEALRTNWGNNSFSTFVLLPENYPVKKLEAQFPAFLDKHMGTMAMEENEPLPSTWTSLHFEPLTDIHLKSHLDSEIEENGDIRRVYIFSIIALFVLLIACINYMNLTTARSAIRAREIGVRKVVGAYQSNILMQFLSESVLLAFLAALLAFGMACLALPFVNELLGQELRVPPGAFWVAPVLLLGLTAVTGFLAGSYPAFHFSALKPLSVRKNDKPKRGGGTGLRKVLVVSQFAISVVLIIATVVVFRQLQYMQNQKLGLNKDHVVTAFCYNALASRYESFRNEILNN